MILINLFKKFFTELITGLIKCLFGQLSLGIENMLMFLSTVHYQEVHTLNAL